MLLLGDRRDDGASAAPWLGLTLARELRLGATRSTICVSSNHVYNGLLIEGGSMSTVTISPKYQVVIPKKIRTLLSLKPGQKVQAIAYEGRIELIPLRPVSELRGFARGIDTTVEREPDRS